MRRLRRTAALRRLVAETHVVPSQLVWPQFVVHGEGVRRPIAALPGVAQLSVDQLVKDAERAASLGLGGIILFGIPATKDATGSEAYDDQGIVQQAIRAVKRAVPDLVVIGDVCLCEYTDHGHCGVIRDGDRRVNFRRIFRTTPSGIEWRLELQQDGEFRPALQASCTRN